MHRLKHCSVDDLAHSLCHPVVPNSRCRTPVCHEWWHSLAVWLQDAAGSHSHDASCYSLGSRLEKCNTTHKIRKFSIGRLGCLGWVMNPSFLSDLHLQDTWGEAVMKRNELKAYPLVSNSSRFPEATWSSKGHWSTLANRAYFFFANERMRFKPCKNKMQSNLTSQKESHDKHACSLWHIFPRK